MEVQIRDPVHDFISLRVKEERLLATRALQRLRRIRQLAMTCLVYPGALHTRFDHTLGVMHVAGLMAEALNLSPDDVAAVRIAALLHDIGHGPFSHVSEYALERYADRATLKPEQKKEKIHELVTGLMIQNDAEIARVLGRDDCDRVAQLLAAGYGEQIMRQIVSGPLDADKQDYLLRDSYFCGVQYGVFDHHQLHRSLVSVPDNHDHTLMIKADGVHAVEQYVLAKYYLTTNVYRHKARIITDQMIVRAIILGVERDRLDEMRTLFAFDNSPAFVERYAAWDDDRFLQTFGGGEGKCGNLIRRLIHRELLKRVFFERPTSFKPEVRERLLSLVKPGKDAAEQQERAETRLRIERRIAELIASAAKQQIDPDLTILHAFDVQSVKEMSRNDEAGILVSKHPQPIPFEQESSLFRSIDERFNDKFVEVYVPVTWNHHVDRHRLCSRLRGGIIEAIEKELAPPSEGAPS